MPRLFCCGIASRMRPAMRDLATATALAGATALAAMALEAVSKDLAPRVEELAGESTSGVLTSILKSTLS